MFGVSFPEFLVLGTVALLVLGPEKLPGMLRTMGQWVNKLRKLTNEVRHQSGIDDVLRAEGFDGGLNELRSIMRGGAPAASHSPPVRAPAPEQFVPDKSREYPTEGPDAYGALPEDLVAPASPVAAALPGVAPEAPVALPANPAPSPLLSAAADPIVSSEGEPAAPTIEPAATSTEPLASTAEPVAPRVEPAVSKPEPPEAGR